MADGGLHPVTLRCVRIADAKNNLVLGTIDFEDFRRFVCAYTMPLTEIEVDADAKSTRHDIDLP